MARADLYFAVIFAPRSSPIRSTRSVSRRRWTLNTIALCALALLLAPTLVAQVDAPATTAAPVPASRQAQHVVAITIEGPIDKWTSYSVQRRLERAQALGADGVVFDIDSPGGEVGAVLEICTAIKASPIPNTVAWINRQAYSGGAIVALACKEIVVNDPSTMGDAAPISVSPVTGLHALPNAERQKLLAPLLAEVVDSARRHGYDEKLVQAFVATDVELWLVENIETGQRLFIDEQEYALLFDNDPPRSRRDISAADAPPFASGGQLPEVGSDRFELATSDASPALEKEVAETLAFKGSESRRPVLSGADAGKYRLLGYAVDGGLLTLTTTDLERYGFAERIVRNDEQLLQFFGGATLTRLDSTWSESLARFLDSFFVKGLLVVVFLLALFTEMAAPGIGLAGGVALFCLALLVAPQFLVGAASWWGIAAIVGGLGLILVEIFVLPGFGIPGVSGIILMLFGLLGVIVGPGGFTRPGAGEDLAYAAATLLLALFTAAVGMYFISKHYRTIPLMNRLILVEHVGEEKPATLLSAMAATETDGVVSVGDIGVAITPLRPAGTAEINDKLVDVVSEFGFVDSGRRVRVISVGRFRIGVEPVTHEEASA